MGGKGERHAIKMKVKVKVKVKDEKVITSANATTREKANA